MKIGQLLSYGLKHEKDHFGGFNFGGRLLEGGVYRGVYGNNYLTSIIQSLV